ncbi:YopX family protein [Bacillus altitudinis]|uniref:YopX family protein n=1 Tax=Bacillus altitudinis TaxID=293387 RepID=UPI003D1E0B4D
MREIKFRAFEKHSQRMFYNVQSGIYMDPDEFESFNDILGLARYKVMQLSGLKDKNGDEIYEGDFVKIISPYYGQEIIATVRYENSLASFVFETGEDRGYSRIDASFKDIEVVGNIYEDPDLLEEAR